MKNEESISKAIGGAGEWWVAAILQFQGAENGYRVAMTNIDDIGTDLFLIKYKNGKIENTVEIQVKTARTTTKNRAYFRMSSLVKHGMRNPNRLYIFVYVPFMVECCWVFTEKELIVNYPGLGKAKNISFCISEESQDVGSKFRCPPNELYNKVNNLLL